MYHLSVFIRMQTLIFIARTGLFSAEVLLSNIHSIPTCEHLFYLHICCEYYDLFHLVIFIDC